MIFILQKRRQITVSKNNFLTERKSERCHTEVAAFILRTVPGSLPESIRTRKGKHCDALHKISAL